MEPDGMSSFAAMVLDLQIGRTTIIFNIGIIWLWFSKKNCDVVQNTAGSHYGAHPVRCHSHFWMQHMESSFESPKERSIMHRVILWALLNSSSFLVTGLKNGVMRYGEQAYPLSPSNTPSVKPVPSSWRPIADVRNMWLSCAEPLAI